MQSIRNPGSGLAQQTAASTAKQLGANFAQTVASLCSTADRLSVACSDTTPPMMISAGDLTICGLQSEFCVDTTARRALALGYLVVLVADGHSTLANGILTAEQISRHHTLTLSQIDSFGPRVRSLAANDISFGA